MEEKKLGVIVPVSREFLQYSVSNFFSEVRPLIAEAFYKKFDEATILGVDNPFTKSCDKSITDRAHNHKSELSYDTLIELYCVLYNTEYYRNAFISKRYNNRALR